MRENTYSELERIIERVRGGFLRGYSSDDFRVVREKCKELSSIPESERNELAECVVNEIVETTLAVRGGSRAARHLLLGAGRLLQTSEEKARLYLYVARSYLQEDRPKKAHPWYQRAYSLFPHVVTAQHLVSSHSHLGNLEHALIVANQAARVFPDSEALLFERAQIYMTLGGAQAAYTDLKNVLSLETFFTKL